MAQALRRSVQAPVKAGQPSPAPPPADVVNGMESARQLLKSLERIARKGGTFSTDPDIKPYAFYGGKHLSLSQVLQENLWKFELSLTARNVLDHMSVHHDDQALVKVTQGSLALKFGCSQSKVSRAIAQLGKHNFAWKKARGVYQLHPLYVYRWGSRKQRILLNKLGAETLAEHEIVIPSVRNEVTR
ncbi:replication/maintenance protein RepL [Streptomyces sp. NPDC002073]